MIDRRLLLELLASRTCANSAGDPEGLLEEAEVIRCADALAASNAFVPPESVPTLTRLQRAVLGATQGRLVVQCLRAYEEFRADRTRALEAVATCASRMAPKVFRPWPADTERAADLYTDCFLVFAEFVAAWNRRQIRSVRFAM